MYQSFKVTNFRCFRELTIPNIERVNLIAGINNVGKTALLEALFIHSGAYNPELTMRINAFRGIEIVKVELGGVVETPWDSLFNKFDIRKTVEFVGDYKAAGRRILQLRVVRQPEELAKIDQYILHSPNEPESIRLSSEAAHVLELQCKEGEKLHKHYMIFDPKGIRVKPIPSPPPYKGIFLPAQIPLPGREDAERFGKLEITKQQDVVLKALQVIEPRLHRLAVVAVGDMSIIHGDVGLERLVPLPVMGGGMIRLARLVLAIGDAQNGVVLVDEIENGFHHSILPKIWRAIAEVARKFNTQVFATTHSLECIVAAHRAFVESGIYDFRLHRLESVKDTIRAITYDQQTLEAAIETGLEVR
jgi:hypothetical protein